jgi:protein-S-isoprenylcysteine O-methyltransferase Ste14
MIYIYLISWKEEKELVKEFGSDYEEYQKRVPMFIPRVKLR